MEKTTVAQQIGDLSNLVIRCDNVINNIDNIIDFNQKQRILLIEQRAQLNVLKDMLTPHPAASSKLAAEVGLVVAIDYVIEKLGNAIDKGLDAEAARTEQTLKEQRKWKAEHPGQQRQ